MNRPMHQKTKRTTIMALLAMLCFSTNAVAFCDPPLSPMYVSDVLIIDYRAEIRAEYEAYFSDAQSYLGCMERERVAVMAEIKQTATQYGQFLDTTEILNSSSSDEKGDW